MMAGPPMMPRPAYGYAPPPGAVMAGPTDASYFPTTSPVCYGCPPPPRAGSLCASTPTPADGHTSLSVSVMPGPQDLTYQPNPAPAHYFAAAWPVEALYTHGQAVEYYSETYKDWVPAVVEEVRLLDSAVMLDVKRGVWVTLSEQPSKLRKRVATAAQEQRPPCITEGCCRPTYNGQAGKTCCRSCGWSSGANHGPECERRHQLGAVAVGMRRSFATSLYKTVHVQTPDPFRQHKLFAALDDFLEVWLPEATAEERADFYNQLQQESLIASSGQLTEIEAIATRLWSSAHKCMNRELCSILNTAIRSDRNLESAMVLVRAINLLCVQRHSGPIPQFTQSYRGGGLPNEHQAFFVQGKQYRAPMFLATTTKKEGIALQQFARKAQVDASLPPVLYVFHFDPERGSLNANYLGACSLVCIEAELLFSPYSVFTVRSVSWKDSPNYAEPHVIELDVAYDNALESEDLPLAPWH
eukprot:NODE_8235_length_1512_cov_5.008664.p1 GENE.NODE_8235_length_1512_cov_5.008664~~NODE_8235_length_1512_cov_5.008664.p1  ORF type:complete len:470 (+),score=79.63 NODE_8235_length_1512_cov_5.008664:2-1411(+)